MSSAPTRSSPAWLLPACLLAVYVLWSSTYLALKFAMDGMPPMIMVGVRYVLSGAILIGYLVARGEKLPSARQWLRATVVGTFFFVGGNGFVALGEVSVGSGLAAVIVATMPLWLAFFAGLGGERPSRRELSGLLIGLVGVLVLSLEGELRGAPLATFFLFLAPLSWAIGSLLTKRLELPKGAMAPATEMLTGGVVAGLLGLVVHDTSAVAPTSQALIAIAYLIVAGSLIGFMAFDWLLRNTRPALATSYAFVNPILAVVLGAALGAERFGWQTAAAAPLIVVAVALVVTSKAAPKPVQGEPGEV